MADEVEVKLGAWPGFELPDLDGAAPGLRAGAVEVHTLDATYHDAADLRLIRAGITLRHRTGEGDAEGTWTLKFPTDGHGPAGALVRDEHVVPGASGDVPAVLAELLRPWIRTAPLQPIAHLETLRRSSALVLDEPEGAPAVVGCIDDDEVSVLQDQRVAARFRELELEVAEGTSPEVLDAVVARLRAAGAGTPDPTPKLVRALGPRALQPSDLSVGGIERDAPAAQVLRAGIAGAVRRIVEHDRVIRDDVDPEGIHQARVGTRRLRSDLRTFRPLVDPVWSEPLRDELRWFAGELGAVRDRDVLAARLRGAAKRLSAPEQEAAGQVIARLDRERNGAQRAAVAALDSDRYLALLDRLVDAAVAPRTVADGDGPARRVLPGLAATAYSSLRKGVKRLGRSPGDEALHALRIKAKRVRYAVELAIPVVEEAKATAKAAAALQDVLGDLHDCAVAESWLRDVQPRASRAQSFALGLLVGIERQEADRLRGEWKDAWKALDRRGLTRWLDA